MKNLMLTTAGLALCALPNLAAADAFSGNLSLGYANLTVDGESEQTTSLTGQVELETDAGLVASARFDRLSGKLEGGLGNLGTTLMGVSAGYKVTPALGLGVYVERSEIDLTDFGDLAQMNSYGVTLGYQAYGVDLEAFYGRSTTEEDMGGVKIEDMGLFSRTQFGPALTLASNAVVTRISDSGDSAMLMQSGLAVVYAANDQVTVFGGVSRTSPDGLDVEATTSGLGVSYDTSAMTSFGSVLSLELARTTLSVDTLSEDLDTVRLGLTIPFGAAASKVPGSSVAGSVMTPSHSAVSSLLLTAF